MRFITANACEENFYDAIKTGRNRKRTGYLPALDPAKNCKSAGYRSAGTFEL